MGDDNFNGAATNASDSRVSGAASATGIHHAAAATGSTGAAATAAAAAGGTGTATTATATATTAEGTSGNTGTDMSQDMQSMAITTSVLGANAPSQKTAFRMIAGGALAVGAVNLAYAEADRSGALQQETAGASNADGEEGGEGEGEDVATTVNEEKQVGFFDKFGKVAVLFLGRLKIVIASYQILIQVRVKYFVVLLILIILILIIIIIIIIVIVIIITNIIIIIIIIMIIIIIIIFLL